MASETQRPPCAMGGDGGCPVNTLDWCPRCGTSSAPVPVREERQEPEPAVPSLTIVERVGLAAYRAQLDADYHAREQRCTRDDRARNYHRHIAPKERAQSLALYDLAFSLDALAVAWNHPKYGERMRSHITSGYPMLAAAITALLSSRETTNAGWKAFPPTREVGPERRQEVWRDGAWHPIPEGARDE